MRFINLVVGFILSVLVFGMAFAEASDPVYSVGDKVLGGTVFFVNTQGTHGLVTANFNQGQTYDLRTAINYCSMEFLFDADGQAYLDWKIPTSHQLDLLYAQRNWFDNLNNYTYWAVEPQTYVSFKTGNHFRGTPLSEPRMRCIRSF